MIARRDEVLTVQFIMRKFSALGSRMVIGCLTAVISVVLLFFAPEIGLVGGAVGIAIGVVSAVLVNPVNRA